MPKLYRSREGSSTAVDTKAQMTTLGSQAAPGPLQVPAGATELLGVITAFGCDLGIAADGTIFVRLEGNGLPEGPETLTIGAVGAAVATGGLHTTAAMYTPLHAKVTPGNEISLFHENDGEDMNVITTGVTLVFAV